MDTGIFLIPPFISFIFVLIFTPFLIKKLKQIGVTGIDVHKKDKYPVAEMGGISIFLGFFAGYMILIFNFPFKNIELVALLFSVSFAMLIGLIDDIKGIRQKIKAFLPALAAIPLMYIQAGEHTMFVPFMGFVDFGIIYPLVLIPFGLMVVSNAFNLLAGYNGLEAGLGLISTSFIGLISLLMGNLYISAVMFTMAAALLGFLIFNKYPAKIFPGDTGVFIIGAVITGAVILGNMEVIGIILLIPHIVNGAITSTDILRGKPIEKFAKVDKDGYIRPPSRKYVYNLYYTISSMGNFTEKKLVYTIWLLEFICGILALVVFYVN